MDPPPLRGWVRAPLQALRRQIEGKDRCRRLRERSIAEFADIVPSPAEGVSGCGDAAGVPKTGTNGLERVTSPGVGWPPPGAVLYLSLWLLLL